MAAARWYVWLIAFGWSSFPAAYAQPAKAPDMSFLPVHKAAIGVTRKGTEIPVWLPRELHKLEHDSLRILIIGGNDGSAASVRYVEELAAAFQKLKEPKTRGANGAYEIAFIPNVYPDGPPEADAATDLSRGFPPVKGFYDAPGCPEAAYLWRWTAMYGAHLVIDVRAGKQAGLWGDKKLLANAVRAGLFAEPNEFLPDPPEDDFIRKLSAVKVEDLPPTASIIMQIPADWKRIDIPLGLIHYGGVAQSPARAELLQRQKRTAEQIVHDLTTVYGRDLKQVAYIPALAVIGRMRAAEHFGDQTETRKLTDLLEPLRSGQSNPVPKSGSEQAGHLLFAELAKRSKGQDRARWIELCRAAADQIFDKDGKPKDLMPYHNEMSDAVFMATPIICVTGKLSGEKKYFDAAVTHFRNMKKLCLRADGIYRHSPLDEAAWGRGNGFPAMGLAWALSEFPEDHADFPELKQDFQNHIAALLKHQDEFGCWHQVIDKAGSYREFSVTCMIGWALKRGIDRGWLDKATHQKPLDRAWIAAQQRIGPKGVVVDICTGTGKQKSLRDYYDRPAIWGVDARGGAMALMFATEMMNAE